MLAEPGRIGPPPVIRRSDRARHARLTVTAQGEVLVVLPRRAPASAADELVRRHAAWVQRQVARAQARNARLAARPTLTGGRTLTVGGVPHRVLVDPGTALARGRVEQHRVITAAGSEGVLVVRLGQDEANGRDAHALVEAWLRAEARRLLTARVSELASVVGVSPTGLSVRDQRSRWGSASRSGRLSFSWRLLLAAPEVLDYVVIHELAHLRVAGHGPRFWAVVQRHAPQATDARRWLREHHAELMAALD